MAVICNHNGDDGDTSLDRKMKGSLLEGQQYGILGVTPCALGEHPDTLLLRANLVCGAAHGLPGILAILAVDEDAPAQAHEPAEEGHLLERALGGDAAVLGEHGAEHEDIELGLVVPDEDGRARGAEDVRRVVNLEVDARGEAHEVVEGAAGGPLGDALVTEEGEDDGGEDAEDGGEEEADVRGEGPGDEGGLGDGEGEGVHGCGEQGVAYEEVGDVAVGEHCERGWGGALERRLARWKKEVVEVGDELRE